jgi:opacity protein-like surface antigen
MCLVAGIWLAPAPVSAQYVDTKDDERFSDEFEENSYHIVGRMRAIGIFNPLLGIGFERHAANWTDGPNFSYGLEWVWRKKDAFELSIAGEYADLSMPSEFWLEDGDPRSSADHLDFNLGVASLTFSGYYYFPVTDVFQPYVGGGLGLGVTLGDVTKYNPADGTMCESQVIAGNWDNSACFDDSGNRIDSQFEPGEPEDRIWPVVPIVNATAGARFNIHRNGIVKVEFGFYDYLYAGVSAGARWK